MVCGGAIFLFLVLVLKVPAEHDTTNRYTRKEYDQGYGLIIG